jgi:hypothetical protein
MATAQAFIWAEQEGSVKQTTAPVAALAAPGCTCLQELAKVIKASTDLSQHLEAADLAPMTAVLVTRAGNEVRARVDYVASAYKVLSAQGTVVETGASEPISAFVDMQYMSGAWKVTRFGLAK